MGCGNRQPSAHETTIFRSTFIFKTNLRMHKLKFLNFPCGLKKVGPIKSDIRYRIQSINLLIPTHALNEIRY